MSEQTRSTLKNYFKIGRKPSQAAFEDLIDSSLNMIDEGIRKTPQRGLILSQLGSGKLLTLDKKDAAAQSWSVSLDEANTIGIGITGAPPVVQLSPNGEIRINGDALVLSAGLEGETQKTNDFNVTGWSTSTGRRGNFQTKGIAPPKADGKWHDLIKEISGCQCFEVMAGAKNSGKDKYALVHAIAMNAENPESIFNRYFKRSNLFIDFFRSKKKIRTTHAYYNQKCDKLRLRWVTPDPDQPHLYSLQIKTNCCYGDDTKIRYHITRLWDDGVAVS
ncbi:hypothetical protein [Desulfobacter curvatus]|uniref:hypothetical protein n=1 Tax=Desulfobacter curvatus TaxID=2290 RepID=UPI000367A7FE|nr:hypothetical protein [Desulfobacter curvatus]